MINTSCTKCGGELIINNGWQVENAGTLTKRTKTKEPGTFTFNARGYLVNVDPGLYLPEGQTVYQIHVCREDQ